MSLGERLIAAVGRDISEICPNRFHSPEENHCAHFAAHMCGLGFSYHCKQYAGGTRPGANIRVHEIFAQCPKVGRWADADPARTQLIFVTLERNVDLERRRMVNIPQKHMGVVHDGVVYHYGNSVDEVVTDSPASFEARFQELYSGHQGVFYGWIPGENLMLNVVPEGVGASAEKKFELPDPVDGRWRARLIGENDSFLVGKETIQPARNFYGIFTPGAEYWGEKYRASDYSAELDHWALLLEVTGACESENYFNLVNTYDRAKFTFGFYQLAAHTPNDNLILLFRRMSELPAFSSYFPDLEIRGGLLTRVDPNGSATNLEEEFDTPRGKELLNFMNYLNPRRRQIDLQEVLQAARLIHWSENDAAMRRTQVHVSAEILQLKMARRYHPKLGLEGRSDVICAIVADIFHNGRGRYTEVKPIVEGPDPVERLLSFKNDEYARRNTRLRAAIADSGLGNKVYVAATNDFR